MQPGEVRTVQCQHAPRIGARKLEHCRVRQCLAGSSNVVECQDIVTEPSKRLGDWKWEVLVGKKARHQR